MERLRSILSFNVFATAAASLARTLVSMPGAIAERIVEANSVLPAFAPMPNAAPILNDAL